MKHPGIAQIRLFGSVPSDELEHIFLNLTQIDLPAHTLIFREGDFGNHFYVVLDGAVEIIKALGTSDERLLNARGPGESFGEMALLDPQHSRSASVRTRTEVTLLEIKRGDFDAMLRLQPALAYDMARMLSLRLRDADNATIRDLQEKNRQLAKAYQDLQAAQALIIEKEKMERELEVAREIQRSLLPRSLPHLLGFDFGARMEPARAVGGDFFDFIPLGDDRLGIAVGDVSGKGVPAAIFMAMTRSLMRAEAREAASPKEALRGLNENLLEMNDTGMFVTVLYGVLHAATCSFTYGRAGHELPVLCNELGETVTPCCGRGEPLGISTDPEIDEKTMQLTPGETLLIYTDGMTDAFDEQGVSFGVKRLHESLGASCHLSAQGTCDSLIELVMTHQCMVTQHDDVTLVAVRVSEDNKKVGRRDIQSTCTPT
jgi:sigma-B regulation protein RsbU (phosphoserine phosphatase)